MIKKKESYLSKTTSDKFTFRWRFKKQVYYEGSLTS